MAAVYGRATRASCGITQASPPAVAAVACKAWRAIGVRFQVARPLPG